MTIRFDDKGKFFTDVISKEGVAVVLQTAVNMIEGKIHVRPGERLKDALNEAEPFFAVTEATIYDKDGKIIYRTDFLAVHREQIIWLLPQDQLIES